jgi:hypothetical protein
MEVAVLVAVFPILDVLVAKSGSEPRYPVPVISVIAWSAVVVVPFLIAAVILAKRGE